MDKIDLIARIKSLHSIIECINERNCFDEVIKFFQITSELQDRSKEFGKLLPSVESFESRHGLKPLKRKRSEANRAKAEAGLRQFLDDISKAGRDGHSHRGCNRTEPGEMVTKHCVFFTDMADERCLIRGVVSIDRAEQLDEVEQALVKRHIIKFVKSFTDSFNIDWLS